MAEIGAEQCPIAPDAIVPGEVDPKRFDPVCLAMQEPQYSALEVRDLIGRIAASRTPCLSIMNMPLPPFLGKIVALKDKTAALVFAEPNLWRQYDLATM